MSANDPNKQAQLTLSLFGDVTVSVADRQVNLKSKKLAAMLGYIALAESQTETRERLVGLFWSESDEERARASLRQALRRLRRDFGDAGYTGLYADNLRIALGQGTIQVDILDVIRRAEEGEVHPLLLSTRRYTDEILRAIEDIDPAFRSWLLATRQGLHNRLLRTLEEGMTASHRSERDQARFAEAVFNLDPTHEQACRHLMRIRASSGDVSGALRVYKTLWDLLDDEYGMEPSEETADLVSQIKLGHFSGTSDDQKVAGMSSSIEIRHHKPILIVEDFQTTGIEPNRLQFVHGFRHSLIAFLVQFREWHITEGDANAADAPQDFPVYRISTTAYGMTDSVKLVVTLKNLQTNSFVWSDQCDLNIETWLQTQYRVVKRLTQALNIHLSVERLVHATEGSELPTFLHDKWLRGQSLILKFSHDNWREAQTLFHDVIDEAPAFSPAYSSLAQLGNTAHIAQPGVFRSKELQDESLTLAKKAVELDPIDSRAQLCLAWAYAFSRSHQFAVLHFDLAVELNDHDPWTLISAAQGHAFHGAYERAEQLRLDAVDATPLPNASQWGYHAGILFFRGEYEKALEAAIKSKDSLANNGVWRAASRYYLGMEKEAHIEAGHCLALIRKRWIGNEAPSDEEVTRWLLHLFPISHQEDWERLREGLRGAGFPVENIRYTE